MKSDRKPPLARSPIGVRSRRGLRSNSASMQTPPGSLAKSQKPNLNLSAGVEETKMRPEYHTISCELQELAKLVRAEFGDGESENGRFDDGSSSTNRSPLFERGRFYDVYSARRNERLKSKKGTEAKTVYNLGVNVEITKRNSSKKRDGLKKSVSTTYSAAKNETATPRYLLRSMTKENKKPPLSLNTQRKTGTRRV